MASQVNFNVGAQAGAASDAAAAAIDPTQDPSLYGASQDLFGATLQTDPFAGSGLQPTPGSGANMAMANQGYGSPPSTVGNALESFYSLTPDQQSQVEQQLWNGGFYSSSDYKAGADFGSQDGNWVDASYNAWKSAVTRAARQGVSVDTILNAAAAGNQTGLNAPGGPGSGSGSGGGGVRIYPGGKVTVDLTNPDDVRYIGDTIAQKLVGKKLTDAQVKAIVDTVQGQEKSAGAAKAAADEASREASIQSNEALYGQQATNTVGGASQFSGKMSPQERAQVAYQAGFRGQALVDAVAISMAEGDNGEINNNPSTGDYSVGPWQINYYGGLGAARTAKYGPASTLANDPQKNAAAAFDLSGGGSNFAPWSTYKSGAYKKFLGAAAAAAAPYLQGQLQQAGVPVQGVTPGGSNGGTTDVFLQPTISDINTPVNPEAATAAYLRANDATDVQTYALVNQFNNFSQALHSMPGDKGAAEPSKA